MESTRAVRRSVSDVLSAWECDTIVADAMLGASELATNAVLHARGDFELAMRPVEHGARIEIIDHRPDLEPLPVPTTGTATAVTSQGTTGRGLQIVAAIARRWGFATSQEYKSVWLELVHGVDGAPTAPVVERGYRARVDPGARTFEFLSLPVRAAVASGVHVDDLVRELQLAPSTRLPAGDVARLYELLDASAPGRLHGRHFALDAAARGQDRCDMRVALTPDALRAFAELNDLLDEATATVGQRAVPLPAPVAAFRRWILEEVQSQLGGHAPAPCPLPS